MPNRKNFISAFYSNDSTKEMIIQLYDQHNIPENLISFLKASEILFQNTSSNKYIKFKLSKKRLSTFIEEFRDSFKEVQIINMHFAEDPKNIPEYMFDEENLFKNYIQPDSYYAVVFDLDFEIDKKPSVSKMEQALFNLSQNFNLLMPNFLVDTGGRGYHLYYFIKKGFFKRNSKTLKTFYDKIEKILLGHLPKYNIDLKEIDDKPLNRGFIRFPLIDHNNRHFQIIQLQEDSNKISYPFSHYDAYVNLDQMQIISEEDYFIEKLNTYKSTGNLTEILEELLHDIIKPNYIKEYRHDFALHFGGSLAKIGVPRKKAIDIYKKVFSEIDEEIDDRERAIKDSYDRYKNSPKQTATLKSLLYNHKIKNPEMYNAIKDFIYRIEQHEVQTTDFDDLGLPYKMPSNITVKNSNNWFRWIGKSLYYVYKSKEDKEETEVLLINNTLIAIKAIYVDITDKNKKEYLHIIQKNGDNGEIKEFLFAVEDLGKTTHFQDIWVKTSQNPLDTTDKMYQYFKLYLITLKNYSKYNFNDIKIPTIHFSPAYGWHINKNFLFFNQLITKDKVHRLPLLFYNTKILTNLEPEKVQLPHSLPYHDIKKIPPAPKLIDFSKPPKILDLDDENSINTIDDVLQFLIYYSWKYKITESLILIGSAISSILHKSIRPYKFNPIFNLYGGSNKGKSTFIDFLVSFFTINRELDQMIQVSDGAGFVILNTPTRMSSSKDDTSKGVYYRPFSYSPVVLDEVSEPEVLKSMNDKIYSFSNGEAPAGAKKSDKQEAQTSKKYVTTFFILGERPIEPDEMGKRNRMLIFKFVPTELYPDEFNEIIEELDDTMTREEIGFGYPAFRIAKYLVENFENVKKEFKKIKKLVNQKALKFKEIFNPANFQSLKKPITIFANSTLAGFYLLHKTGYLASLLETENISFDEFFDELSEMVVEFIFKNKMSNNAPQTEIELFLTEFFEKIFADDDLFNYNFKFDLTQSKRILLKPADKVNNKTVYGSITFTNLEPKNELLKKWLKIKLPVKIKDDDEVVYNEELPEDEYETLYIHSIAIQPTVMKSLKNELPTHIPSHILELNEGTDEIGKYFSVKKVINKGHNICVEMKGDLNTVRRWRGINAYIIEFKFK